MIISEGCYEKTKVGCDDKMHMSVAILPSTELQILNGYIVSPLNFLSIKLLVITSCVDFMSRKVTVSHCALKNPFISFS